MHPVLFSIFGFQIYSYGAMLLISFLLSTSLAVHLGKQRGYPKEFIMDLCMWAIMAGIIGCRMGYVLEHIKEYIIHRPITIGPLTLPGFLEAFNLREGGMTITGGVTLSVLSIFIYFRRKGVPALNVLDFLAPPLLVGMAWGRVGCLLHGCCFGSITHVPWAMWYPRGALGVDRFGVELDVGPRHPAPIYEMGMDMVLLAYLLWQLPRLRFAGQNLYTVFAGYGVIRFIDEMFREIDWYPMGGPLSQYQWVALAFFVFGVLGLLGVFGRPPVVTDWVPPEERLEHAPEALPPLKTPA